MKINRHSPQIFLDLLVPYRALLWRNHCLLLAYIITRFDRILQSARGTELYRSLCQFAPLTTSVLQKSCGPDFLFSHHYFLRDLFGCGRFPPSMNLSFHNTPGILLLSSCSLPTSSVFVTAHCVSLWLKMINTSPSLFLCLRRLNLGIRRHRGSPCSISYSFWSHINVSDTVYLPFNCQ